MNRPYYSIALDNLLLKIAYSIRSQGQWSPSPINQIGVREVVQEAGLGRHVLTKGPSHLPHHGLEGSLPRWPSMSVSFSKMKRKLSNLL